MTIALRRTAAVAMIVMATAVLGACGGGGSAAPAAEEPTFDFVIPAGSGDRIAQGESLDILPAEMDTKVGETIRITNEDDIGHVLGPWFLGPGETLRQRFVVAGVFSGFCSVHPEESFTVNVAEA